jgi:hypothetical protein
MYFQVLEDFRHINTIIHYHGFKSAKWEQRHIIQL